MSPLKNVSQFNKNNQLSMDHYIIRNQLHIY